MGVGAARSTRVVAGERRFEGSVRGNAAAIEHMRGSIAQGKHWYLALLEAMALWTSAEETYQGRHYSYLIAGEAFDWLLLAERLTDAVDEVPQEEREALLFHGRPPLELAEAEFRRSIGSAKHRYYLNYFYGITLEEMLILAVEEEVRKEQRLRGRTTEGRIADIVHERIYGATEESLLRRFQAERGYPQLNSITLEQLKEFTYWRFKYRLKACERARVASDTRKALDELERQRAACEALPAY